MNTERTHTKPTYDRKKERKRAQRVRELEQVLV
jgi:hypothetical protein